MTVFAQPSDANDPAQVTRALVIKLRHLGDVLLSSPVLSVLKNAAPRAEIDALVYADTTAMLRGHPALSRLHLQPRGRKGTWQERLGVERALLQPDCLVTLQPAQVIAALDDALDRHVPR